MATAILVCRTARKRSAQARSWKPGRRRQRWKPEGAKPAGVRCAARQRDRPCFLAGDAHAINDGQHGRDALDEMLVVRRGCRAGAAGAAVSRGAKRSAAGMATRPSPGVQAKRAAPQARRHRHRAQQKKSASPRRTTLRMVAVRSVRGHLLQLLDHARFNEHAWLLVLDLHIEYLGEHFAFQVR